MENLGTITIFLLSAIRETNMNSSLVPTFQYYLKLSQRLIKQNPVVMNISERI